MTYPLLVALEVSVGLVLSRRGVRFDGFMDAHRTLFGEPVRLGVAIGDEVA